MSRSLDDTPRNPHHNHHDDTHGGVETRTQSKRKPLPPYRVLLHNDNENDQLYVVRTIVALTPLGLRESAARMLEAHKRGLALLLTTHQERAELYVQQFASCSMTVTIEPAT